MNQKDADLISLKDGDSVQLEILKVRLTLKVKIENTLQNGNGRIVCKFARDAIC